MTCRPLIVEPGPFVTGGWLQGPPQLPATPQFTDGCGNQVTYSQTTVIIERAGRTIFTETAPLNHELRIMQLGTGCAYLMLTFGRTATGDDHSVVCVDCTSTTATSNLVLGPLSVPTGRPLPVAQFSQGNGSVFLIRDVSVFGDTVVGLGFFRSDTAASLCVGPLGLPSDAAITAEALPDSLVLHYGTESLSCPLMAANSHVSPQTHDFGRHRSGESSSSSFTIRNTGGDCLLIDDVADAEPFFVQRPGPFPARLGQNESISVHVTFQPTGLFERAVSEDLPIAPAPASGDSVLRCSATVAQTVLIRNPPDRWHLRIPIWRNLYCLIFPDRCR
jgi:hypothetical protein